MGKLIAVFLILAMLSSGSIKPTRPAVKVEAPAAEEKIEMPAREEVAGPTEDVYYYDDVEFIPTVIESEEDVIGDWLRETMYLEHYGCDADMLISFYSDGSYYQLLTDHVDGSVLAEETGTWEWKDGEVVSREDGESGTAHYEVRDGFLVNNEKLYTKLP